MTHFQRVFIQNLRYLRSQRELSQIKLSELVDISPNYLNAVENGKNFPSPEVMQRIIKVLGILPYQLFLEQPSGPKTANHDEKNILIQEITFLKQQLSREFDKVIQKHKHSK
jgi:transcriptional regulator with XRE-family HTH domain